MKPKYLEFCGINSFSRKAEIDFEKLLSGGIFGIFGIFHDDAMEFSIYLQDLPFFKDHVLRVHFLCQHFLECSVLFFFHLFPFLSRERDFLLFT